MLRQRSPSKVKFFDSNRFDYLRKLKNEFATTNSKAAKQETIANLANFAYNPENYDHLYNLEIHQLFVVNLESTDEFITLVSIKGLCNLASYPPICTILCQSDALNKITSSMECNNSVPEFVINCLLLMITLRNNLDDQMNFKLHKIIKELPKTIKTDKRVENLCQILLNE